METRPILRIFISSPSDVRPERLIAERVVQRLSREFSYYFRLEASLWEYQPLLVAHHFQDSQNLPPPSKADIVVVILWSRLGAHLPPDQFVGAVSGRSPVTGTEWEFEDALAAYRQVGRPDLLLYHKTSPITANLDDRSVLETLLKQKEMVEDFFSRWLHGNPDAEFTAASHGFSDAALFEERLETHLRALLSRRLEQGPEEETAPATIRWHRGSPFRGLESFEQEHAPVFFGRNKARIELREILARQEARRCSFIMVTGASGTGKSSLIKAGLIPDLMLPGMVGNVALCRAAIMRPSQSAAGPMAALADALLAPGAMPELKELRYSPERLVALLPNSPDQLCQAIEQGMAQAARDGGVTGLGAARLIVFVDQFEEIFTLDRLTGDQRCAFIHVLARLARSGLVWVLAAMRSDFYDRLQTIPELVTLSAGEARYLLAAPSASETGQIIRRPAREAGLRYETDFRGVGLDEVLCDTAARNPASLPLLEFTLDQLWHRRSASGVLTFAAYHDIGGMEGSIGCRAEAALLSLPPEVQSAFPMVLRTLVTMAEGGQGAATARSVPLQQFPPGTPGRLLVDAFLAPDARLLMAADDGGGARVRLAHEALLTHWTRAAEQLRKESADLGLRSRLELSAALWEKATPNDRGSLLLRPGLPLNEAEDLLLRRSDSLGPDVAGYITASVQAQRSVERRRFWSVVGYMAGLGFFAAVAAAYAVEAEMQRRETAQARERTERSLKLTSEIATVLVVDVGERLRSMAVVPTEAIGRIQDISRQVLDRLAASGDSSHTVEVLKGQLINNMARNLSDKGDTAGRERHGLEALAHFTRMMERGDAGADVLLGAAFSHDTLGDALRQDYPDKALEHYTEAKTLRQRVLVLLPGDSGALRTLSISHNRLGNMHMDRKEWERAEEEYGEALSIRQSLLKRGDLGPEVAADVSLSHNKLGNALLGGGRIPEAVDQYKQSLQVAEREFHLNPNGVRQLNDIAYSYESLGKAYGAANNYQDSFVNYEKCFKYRKDLVLLDAQNLTYKRDLAFCQARVGQAQFFLGDNGGRENILAAYDMMKILFGNSKNKKWQKDINDMESIMNSTINRTDVIHAGALAVVPPPQ